MILLQSGLFQERLKSHGAIVRAMKEGGFVSFGQLKCVVDFVICVGRGDIKLTHEARHAAKDTWHHFDAFGAVGIAIGEIEGVWVCGEAVEVWGELCAIAKSGVVSGEALNDNHDNIGLYPAAAEGSRHGEGRKGG